MADRDSAVDGLAFELIAPPAVRSRHVPYSHLPLRVVGRHGGHWWEQFELPRAVTGELLFCPGNTAPIQVLRGRTPTVVTVHDLAYRYFPKAYSCAFRWLYWALMPAVFHWSKAVLTVSETERARIAGYFPGATERLFAIPNGSIAADRLRRPFTESGLGTKGGQPFFLYVGSLSRRKNLQGFLKAAALVGRDWPGRFVVVGATAAAFQPRAFPVDPNLADRVDFLGQVDRTDDLVDLYRRARGLVFPSFHESSGLPPTEAMACGCPVIVSDIDALRERCGDAALYCDPTSTADIAARMRALLVEPGLADRLRAAGYRRAVAFSWESCTRRSLALFRDILGIPAALVRRAA